jgi:hypothetical protein
MRRFTILGLMGLVFGLAVAIATLRNADDTWAGGLLLGIALFLGVLALGAMFHTDRRREWRLGFAVFGGGYFALAFLGLSEQNLTRLPTSWLLMYVHQRAAPPQTFRVLLTSLNPGPAGQGTVLTSNVSSGPTANTITTTTTMKYALTKSANVNQPNGWRQLLPGAANYEAFSVVGHCLFALLSGLMGAFLALRIAAKRNRALAATGPPIGA